MNKKEFLEALDNRLHGVSAKDRKEALSFYQELIEDSIEDGKKEEAAIEELGDIESVAKKIIEETDRKASTMPSTSPTTMSTERLVLMIILSPFLFTLFAVGFSLIFAAYAIIVSMYLVGFSMILVTLVYGAHFFISLFSNINFAILELGIAIFAAGFGMILWNGMNLLIKKLNRGTKNSLHFFIRLVRGE